MDVIFMPAKTDAGKDTVAQLAATEIGAFVVGNGTEWILAPFGQPLEPVKQVARERGYFFAGILAHLPKTRCIAAAAEGDSPECVLTLAAAVPAFAKHVAAKQNDFADYMHHLWNLPDERD